jgi:hypothetical protein
LAGHASKARTAFKRGIASDAAEGVLEGEPVPA